jgi:hypothetical protein
MFHRKLIFSLATAAMLVVAASLLPAQQDVFSKWPAGRSPEEVGKRLAEHFVTSPHQYSKTIHYAEVCTWYGALTYAQLTKNTELRDALIKKYEPLLPGGAEASRIPQRHHVDDSIFGVIRSRLPFRPATSNSWPWARPGPTGSGKTRTQTALPPRPATGWTTCTC